MTVLATANVSLTVTYRDAARHGHRATLSCRGTSAHATGFLARSPVRACRRARRLPAPPAANRVCTQIYGGPQIARITGRVGARRTDRRLSRTDGCKIDEWNRMVPLVPRPAG
jgi:hypothetical protein